MLLLILVMHMLLIMLQNESQQSSCLEDIRCDIPWYGFPHNGFVTMYKANGALRLTECYEW